MSGTLSRKLWGVVGAFGLVLTTGVIAIPSHSAVDVAEAAVPAIATDVNTVPHYFGPYSNWANSEQALADVTIAIDAPSSGTTATATASVLPNNAITGGIGAITITNPGSGYGTTVPLIHITKSSLPAPTIPAAARAVLSIGAISSVAVGNPGFGFTQPVVTFTGGGFTTEAAASASGGVDDVVVTDAGSFTIQPLVQFGTPPAGGVQATGLATFVPITPTPVGGPAFMVTGVAITNPGSGYTTAPSVTFYDGVVLSGPVSGAATATIGISQITLVASGGTTGGAGYSSTPTVAIADTAPGLGSGALATAKVAIAGAVTSIVVDTPGAGYLTPGIKKFVDTLGQFGPTVDPLNPTPFNRIPIAVADQVTYPGTDYYEIGLVQYRQRFSSSLPSDGTLLRGYVQLSTGVVVGSNVALTNANLDPTITASPATYPAPVSGLPIVAHGVTDPSYLGPEIIAQKNRPVRVLFRNLLPNGEAGDLFLPVDTSLMGSGMGPNAATLDPFTNVPMDMAVNDHTVLDEVRNPLCGRTSPAIGAAAAIPKPKDCYSENRATLHLHGGVTPWISDGTPHQWITPAGENTDYPKGVSVQNVPDMPDPGPGAQTFFYTNQQSARLMWVHDHAWGITRLNVYAGEVSSYLVTDDTEKALIGSGGALAGLGTGTPLIIVDKTFVSSTVASRNTTDISKPITTDPTWDTVRWGGAGNLWTPHVYMPAQNPGDPSGMSAYGRWMYGPWFWPPAKDVKYPPIANPYYDSSCDPNLIVDVTTGELQFCEPELIPSTPNVSVGMEAFNDTPVINGTVYPTTNVAPQAYRYRILNASNDRFWNLSWYVADPRTGTLSEVALNPTELAAAQLDPVVSPTPDENFSPKGPNWIQIGTEGGFLPAPVVVPAQPTTWIMDPTRFDVGNVDLHSLLLAPAERADVVVDFSQFRGKTLILYNDAPAAFPARVPGYDYYTGDPDMGPAGAPSTLPGYGPNTRTIMQVKVSQTGGTTVAFDDPNPATTDRMTALVAAFAHHADNSGVFESGSDPIIVGQAAYNSAYFTPATVGVPNSGTPNQFVASGWCNNPTSPVTVPAAKCDGFARIQEQGAVPGTPDKFSFKFDTLGPVAGRETRGAGTQVAIPFEPKGMHDEMNSANFDEWGRMTANLGLEAPGATPLLQNIILYPYVNPATEILDSTTGMPSSLDVTPISVGTDGTQIWKITHNGVDTHPIHFHLYNVQVLNRVTWDNIIIPPEPTELGWKETVRVSPLEDTIVALRPIVPVLPFAVPDSSRPLNPALPIGAKGDLATAGLEAGFNNTDAAGNPMTTAISNDVTDFGWEYVFHCHILSHEEMDMMRPVTVHVARALPAASTNLALSGGSLSWGDMTPVNWGSNAVPGPGANPATWVAWSALGNAEIGYRVERAVGPTGSFTTIATLPANSTAFTVPSVTATITYRYRVTTFNAAGATSSNIVSSVAGTLPQTKTTMTSSRNPSTYGQSVTYTATVARVLSGSTPTGNVQFMVDGLPAVGGLRPLSGGKATFPTTALTAGIHTVVAVYVGVTGALAGSEGAALTQTVNKGSAVLLVTAAPVSPTAFGVSVTFTFRVTPLAAAAAGSMVRFSVDGVLSGGTVMLNPLTGQATMTTSTLTRATHTISVAYSGSVNYLAATVSRTHRVN